MDLLKIWAARLIWPNLSYLTSKNNSGNICSYLNFLDKTIQAGPLMFRNCSSLHKLLSCMAFNSLRKICSTEYTGIILK